MYMYCKNTNLTKTRELSRITVIPHPESKLAKWDAILFVNHSDTSHLWAFVKMDNSSSVFFCLVMQHDQKFKI